MVISKILAPVFDHKEGGATLSLAAELAAYFHAHVEVAGLHFHRAGARQERSLGEAIVGDQDLSFLFERWRREHRLELQPECVHRGMASTSLVIVGDSPEKQLAERARFADLVCCAVEFGETQGGNARARHAVLYSSGRPVLFQRVTNDLERPSIMGEPIVIGWNGSVASARAVTGALPFLQASRRVEVISIGEQSVNAFDAYELAKFLAWSGVRAAARGIVLEDWTGGDVVDAAIDNGAKLLVMGAREKGNATMHMLATLPIAALMAA